VGLLLTAFLLINLMFVLNTIQDVMAYLMTPFAALMMLGGIGMIPVLEWLRLPAERDTRLLRLAFAGVLIALPVLRASDFAEGVSLRHYSEAGEWVEEVYERFEGKGESAVLLAHWEHLTPLWYEVMVEDHPLAEEDLKLVYVATTSEHPWVDNAWANIEQGPIYVSGYQREMIDAGFRLRPVAGQLYRAIPAPATEAADMQIRIDADLGPVTLVGVDLPMTTVVPGGEIPLNIGLYAEEQPGDILFPYAMLGDVTYQFTTDSHWLTPYWQPGETIVERYDLRAPMDIEAGEYPLSIGLRNLSQGGESLEFPDGSTLVEIGMITIPPGWGPAVPPEDLLADINHAYGLVGAVANTNGQRRVAVWQEPLTVQPGDDIRVRLTWTSLSVPDDNMKVFVHLVDGGNQVIAQKDYPPLGGSFPTFLWFPKWIPGQTVVDPYRLTVPEGTPRGDYRIEAGMYSFTTFQRAPFYDPQGNLSGDFFILGTVRVEP
jgi:hypothetical protein